MYPVHLVLGLLLILALQLVGTLQQRPVNARARGLLDGPSVHLTLVYLPIISACDMSDHHDTSQKCGDVRSCALMCGDVR